MTPSVNFDRAVEYYDQTRGFPPGVEALIPPLFIQAGALTATSRVLEIGIGTGRIALPLAPFVDLYLGIDISTGMMDKLLAKRNGERIFLMQGDAAHLPIASHSLDAITAVHVFHLIPAWREVLSELKRALKPGGMLLQGWNGHQENNDWNKVWDEATDNPRRRAEAIPYEQRETFLRDNGWIPAGEEQATHFALNRSPQDFVDYIRGRRWSHCWTMTDDEIEHGLAVVEAYIHANYPDPTQTVALDSTFHVQAYLPPA